MTFSQHIYTIFRANIIHVDTTHAITDDCNVAELDGIGVDVLAALLPFAEESAKFSMLK